jgi:predicted O-methyltransferase YrrM
MYGSTIQALEALYDRVAVGGYIIVDDYGAVAGCRAAVDDFRAKRGITAPLVSVDWTGHHWRKSEGDYEATAPGTRWDLWTTYKNTNAETSVRLAQEALEKGDAALAIASANAALAHDENAMPAHVLLARLRFPGADYLANLERIHARKQPRTYVEIGVAKGESLRLAGSSCRVIAIDPDPWPTFDAGPVHAELVRKTSRAFFTDGTAETLVGTFDLAFIDGCHRFEEVLHDFAQLEQYAAHNAMIVVHDTLPLDAQTCAPVRRTTFYSGDGWKLLAVLRDIRPELRVRTIPTFPTGLTLIDKLQPLSGTLRRRYDALVARYAKLTWNDYLNEHEAKLTLVPNHFDAVDACVAL